MFRSLAVGSLVASSLLFAGSAQAQTCDPYRTKVSVDYRTYPTPETSLSFFATLAPGTDVEGHLPYVWGYDAQGWYWSCSTNVQTPQPTPSPSPSATLEVGKYYSTPYGQIDKVVGIVTLVGESAPQWLLQSVTPNGGLCGRLGTIPLGNHATNILREVPAQNFPEGCPLALTTEQ